MDDKTTVLRLKRRREDAPVDVLFVDALQSSTKKTAIPVDSLGREFNRMMARSPALAPLVVSKPTRFRRVTSVLEKDAWSRDVAEKIIVSQLRRSRAFSSSGAADNSDRATLDSAASILKMKLATQAARRVKNTSEKRASARRRVPESAQDGSRSLHLETFRVFDVLSNIADNGAAASSSSRLIRRRLVLRPRSARDDLARFIPLSAPSPGRILNPFQREIDAAIWHAFATGDMTRIFAAVRGGSDVNYQRMLSDLTTGLMAAAYHGDSQAAVLLIRKGALVRIADVSGRSAACIASDRGHVLLAAFLRDVLQEEEEEFAASLGVKHSCLSGTSTKTESAVDTAARLDAPDDVEFELDVFVADTDGGSSGDLSESRGVPPDVCSSESSIFRTEDGGGGVPCADGKISLRVALDDVSLAALWAQRGDGDISDGEDEWLARDSGDSDADSEDSCREDAPGNDYPEEEEDGEEGAEGGVEDRDDDLPLHSAGTRTDSGGEDGLEGILGSNGTRRSDVLWESGRGDGRDDFDD